jgi:hypothetical protein
MRIKIKGLKMINTRDLGFINHYIDKNNPKWELNGLYLDSKNKKLVATNTRALIIFEDDELEADGIIPRHLIDAAVKSCVKNHNRSVYFRNREGKIAEIGNKLLIEVQTFTEDTADKRPPLIASDIVMDGKFPDYERILLDKETAIFSKRTGGQAIRRDIYSTGVVLDEKWIIPLIEYSDKNMMDIDIYFNQPDLPIMFECGNITLVVMPIVMDKN